MRTLLTLLLSVVCAVAAPTNTFNAHVNVGSAYTLEATLRGGLHITNAAWSSGFIITPQDILGWKFSSYDEFGTNALMKLVIGGSDATEIYSGIKVPSITNSGTYNGIKVYRATLTQSGGSAPSATVLENTTGVTVTWSRGGPGDYIGTASSAIFNASKTIIHVSGANPSTPFITINSGRVTTTEVKIMTADEFGLIDSVFSATTPGSVSIMIYP